MPSLFQLKKRTKALVRSYFKDWLLVTVVLIAFSIIDQQEPFHRQFSVNDMTIQHPFAKKETIPIWLCLVLAFILPGVIIGAIAIFHRKSYTDLHNGLLGLVLAQALVLIVTDSIKITVGRPRPDFLDRCLEIYDNAAAGTPVPQLDDPINMLTNSTICTRTTLLRDGFKSFPSGHSSFSFGGLGFLSMYLAGKLHLFDERGHIYKSILVLAPLILAALIATSRVADYRHHWQDVTVGSIIGSIFAVFAYRQYYPSLAAVKCGRPFSPRIGEELLPSVLIPHHHHHERLADEEHDYDQGQSFLGAPHEAPGQRSPSTQPGPGPVFQRTMSQDGSSLHEMSPNVGVPSHGGAMGGPGYSSKYDPMSVSDHGRPGQNK